MSYTFYIHRALTIEEQNKLEMIMPVEQYSINPAPYGTVRTEISFKSPLARKKVEQIREIIHGKKETKLQQLKKRLMKQ